MPYIPLRKRASLAEQALGCKSCGTTSVVLYHYTNQGGIKSAHISHGYDPKYLSKDQDFSKTVFCSFGCFEQDLARSIPKIPRACLPKRPF